MALPHRTDTIPEDRRTGFTGPDIVTALRIRGTDIEHVMLAGQPRFILGSGPSCDICVERRYVSYAHAELERRDNRVRVSDIASKNGIVYRGRVERQFDIAPGDGFSIEATTFLAVNDEMRLARPVVAEIVGPERFDVIDDLQSAAVYGSHILVLGEPGNDQRRLADAIHRASLRRRQHLATIEPRDGAALDPQIAGYVTNGTAVLRLDSTDDKPDPEFLSRVLAAESNTRLIICSTSLKRAQDAVSPEVVGRAHHVTIPPLRERAGAVEALLERHFLDRRVPLRFSMFTDENRQALLAYHWPGNLEELREVADLVLRMAPYESERKAAAELDLPRSNIKRRLEATGLTIPLLHAQAMQTMMPLLLERPNTKR